MVAMTSNLARCVAPLLSVCAILGAGCGGDTSDASPQQTATSSATAPAARSRAPGPAAGGTAGAASGPIDPSGRAGLPADVTWQWQIEGVVDIGYEVDLYDIDLADTPVSTIDELHEAGRTVICYFSAGSYEGWRDDADRYPPAAIGEALDGWPDERWVDVRNDAVRAILADRLDLAVAKGCDGVEPDNVAGYDDDNGFGFSFDDQLDFNRFLAAAARERGLLIGLKNALGQIPDLVDHYDFAVNEQCHDYEECEAYGPFLAAGKPVLNAEYAERFVADPEALCAMAEAAGTRTLLLSADLDDSLRIACF
jgi:hypothetical protein